VAVGLYSGVSGLALGIGLYRNVSGLWGGASGLINGFGGADPYAGASLYLDFLTPPLDSRITFSRGTNATLVDSTGKITYAPNNILAFSNDFNNAAWAKLGAGTASPPVVTPNAAVAPDGSTTASLIFFNRGAGTSGSDISYISNNPVTFVGNAIASIWLKTSDGTTKQMQLRCGAPVASVITVTGTWQRFSVLSTNATIDRLQLLLYGTDPNQTASLHVWASQLELVTYQTTPGAYAETTASAYYGPRFDYDPVTLAPRGLLIEEARTNLITYSEQFDNAAWSKTNSTVTANVTASPDGTTNADKLIDNATNATHSISQIFSATSGTSYTFTLYAKAAELSWIAVQFNSAIFADASARTAYVNLSTGAIGTLTGAPTVSVANAANGWRRVTITVAATLTATGSVFVYLANADNGAAYAGTGTSGVFLYGAQVEAGAFATSYIPTVASTVSRSADVATMTGTNFSSWFNASAGTFIADFDVGGVDTTRRRKVWNGSDAGNQRLALRALDVSVNYPLAAIGTGTSVVALIGTALTANTATRVAVAYGANSALSQNGATPNTDANANSVSIASFAIGCEQTVGSEQLNGHMRAIAYYNTRLPNTQLQTLTAPSLASPLALDFLSTSYTVGY
jgi:hypothetical protein